MRKNKQLYKVIRLLDNKGYSLLELLVSMMILIIIMIPLMGNFFRSMKLNREADELQEYSNLAANKVEEVKALNITAPTTLTEVGYAEDGTAYDVRIKVSAEEYRYGGKIGHDTTLMNDYQMPKLTEVNDDLNGMFFSYAIENNTNGEFIPFRQIVEMLKNKAKTEADISDMSVTDILGELNQPELQSLDQTALGDFKEAADAYADEQLKNSQAYADYLQQLEDIKNGKLPPTIPAMPTVDDYYCDLEYIKARITKTLDIQINTDTVNKNTVINYQIIYQCNWPSELSIMNRIPYRIQYKPYTSVINHVYLFYQSSLYSNNHADTIHITDNKDVVSNPKTNFYIIKQAGDDADPSIVINGDVDKINFYTNLPTDGLDDRVDIEGITDTEERINDDIMITSAPEDRVFSIEVTIYKFADGSLEEKYLDNNKLYTLNSNMEK